MINEALQYLAEKFEETYSPQLVHEDDYWRHLLLKTDKEGVEVQAFAKQVNQRRHRFLTLEGFLSYLNSGHTVEDRGAIFVGEKTVSLPLSYQSTVPEVVTLNLLDSEEWTAFQELHRGVNQRELWRLLVTKLAGCVDSSLLMTIGTLSMTRKQGEAATVDPFGLATVKGATETVVTFPAAAGAGEQRRTIANEWIFQVRRWECLPQTFQVLTTLELRSEGTEITFCFHPRRLKQVEEAARATLVEEFRKAVPERFTVHEGEL